MKMITTTKLQTEIQALAAFIREQFALNHHGFEPVAIPRPAKLLDTAGGNTKIKKTSKGAYRYAGLSCRPNRVLCPNAEKAGCLDACLNTAGRGAFNNVQYGRALRSYWLLTDPESFKAQLISELSNFERLCFKQGYQPAVRLNVVQDFNWREVKERFPSILFIDYTKVASRLAKALPNEQLIFSYSASPAYAKQVELALNTDRPIAVVFRNGLPDTFLGRTVIDGDKSDIENALAGPVIVGLRAKGKAKQAKAGDYFVQVGA